jgi:hypothetical protein
VWLEELDKLKKFGGRNSDKNPNSNVNHWKKGLNGNGQLFCSIIVAFSCHVTVSCIILYLGTANHAIWITAVCVFELNCMSMKMESG